MSSTTKSHLTPALSRDAPVEISRVMVPDDTNSAGNVHGGTILKLLEQAGFVVANRHCNQNKEDPEGPDVSCVLVRLEKMDFLQPVHVGDVTQVQAGVTFTSKHSLEVTVDVWAENVISGDRRHSNTAKLWYVALNMQALNTSREKHQGRNLEIFITTVPPMAGLTEAKVKAGKLRYEKQKASRRSPSHGGVRSDCVIAPVHVFHHPKEVGVGTVLASQTTLANVVLPSDCTITGHVTGGTLMKMMDSAGAICTSRHCRNRTVTAGIDVINFHHSINNGEIVYVTARIVFTSSKSMEVEVTTEAEGSSGRHITNTAFFMFVSLGKNGRAEPVPPLICKGEEDLARFEEGRSRYLARKKEREEAYKSTHAC